MQLHSSHRVSGLSVCKSTGWSDSLARLRAHTQVAWRAWCARMYTSQLADLSALSQAAWCVVSKLTDYVDYRSIVRPSPGPYCHLPRAPSPTTLSPLPVPPATLISTRHRSSPFPVWLLTSFLAVPRSPQPHPPLFHGCSNSPRHPLALRLRRTLARYLAHTSSPAHPPFVHRLTRTRYRLTGMAPRKKGSCVASKARRSKRMVGHKKGSAIRGSTTGSGRTWARVRR